MKKRSSGKNPKDLARFQTSNLSDFHEVQSSDCRYAASLFENDRHIGLRKRVKFVDVDTYNPIGYKLDDCTASRDTRATRCECVALLSEINDAADGPKTSEFAFFKKLKKDASNRIQTHPFHKEEIRLKEFKLKDYTGEKASMGKNAAKAFRPALSTVDIPHSDFNSFLSPLEDASINSDVDFTRGSTTPREKLLKRLEECNNIERPGGTQVKHTDIFSMKREKLCQMVAGTLSLERDELCSKGFDLVSTLLSRLFPENNEENELETQKSGQIEGHKKLKLLASPESNICSKKLNPMPTRNIKEVKRRTYMDNISSTNWLDREEFLSYSNSPPLYAQKTLPREFLELQGERTVTSYIESDYEIGIPYKKCVSLPLSHHEELDNIHYREKSLLPSCKLGRERTTDLSTETDFAVGLLHNKHGCLPLSHPEELDDCHGLQKPLQARASHSFLLEWNFENVRDEQKLHRTYQHADLIAYPTSFSVWGDREQCLDDGFGPLCMTRLYEPSILSVYSPMFDSLLPSHSASNRKSNSQREVCGKNEDSVAELKHFPLLLRNAESDLTIAVDCNYDIVGKESSILLSSHNNGCYKEKGLAVEVHPGIETLFPSGLDFSVRWDLLSLPTYHALPFPQKEDKYESCQDGSSIGGIINHFCEDIINFSD